ncbi:MAG: biopolymer transporter ExbD [Elusimicrobia bacterium]|nr:biopolymer transporter ExbD [Elusimicrobiota bacterium]
MQTSNGDDAITDINVTPLVDVCLVLVIIFMAVAPFAVQAGIKVLESRAKAGVGKVTASENVQVRLRKNGTLTVNGRPSSFPRLFQDVEGALSASRDKMVIITADDSNKVGDVVNMMDTSKQAGAEKVAIMKAE